MDTPKITIPHGTTVRVLDTKNVRRYNEQSIGYEFIVDEELYNPDGILTSPGNKYGVNYRESDLLILDIPITNNYSIY